MVSRRETLADLGMKPAIPRITIRRLMVSVAVLAMALVVLRWWRIFRGGTLPLGGLRLGMTRTEVRFITGPPQYVSPDSSSWVVTRPGSDVWLDIQFDADGRVKFFRTDEF